MQRKMCKGGSEQRFDELGDEQLMERSAHDNGTDAFTALVQRHQTSLVNFFRRLDVYSYGVAEDLAQETFIRVFRFRHNYRAKAKFTTFLYTVARHVWIDHVRRKTRESDVLNEYEEYVVGTDMPHERVRLRMDVSEALAALSEKLREVVVLSIYQGLQQKEIAQVLEVPLGTVKSRMHTAMQQLSELIHVRQDT